jgi:bacillithiol biosynthesis cysteine-adding enzyme BshC
MQWQAQQIHYRETGYFNDLVLDYLDQRATLNGYFSHEPSVQGICKAIEERKSFSYDRHRLVQQLRTQYAGIESSALVNASIEKLLHENTFTITTAHQPNLLTGPLYFIYKIIHAIKLADYLNHQLQDYHFVPVFYMGVEDADTEELNNFTVRGKTYQWNTKQQGAFGRMKIDTDLIHLIDELEGQLGNLLFAGELMSKLRNSYTLGKTIAEATFEWVHYLFGKYGLIVLLPDSTSLKSLFADEMKDDLINHTAYHQLNEIKSSFPYPADWQANARPINLFYLKDDLRGRIEFNEQSYKVIKSSVEFNKNELLAELNINPASFSPNVILRPLFQEKILPNLVYIGGSGELAYWLQLKSIFDHYCIPFPVLMLRNSMLLLQQKQQHQLQKLALELTDIFKSADELIKIYVAGNTKHSLQLTEERQQLKVSFKQIQQRAEVVDPTLKQHVSALLKGVIKKIDVLEQKMLRAEKRKHHDASRQITQLKSELFPGNGLQERKESMLGFYAMMGDHFIKQLYENMPVIRQEFTMLTYPASN